MKLKIVTPVYNDWESLAILIKSIEQKLAGTDIDYEILAVNDDSSVPPNGVSLGSRCRILDLTCNLGHQRAIAVGLAYVAAEESFDAVVVMDADGEDDPAYIPALVERHLASPDAVIVARRDRRSETRAFRAGYWLYRLIFRLFTGRELRFGNYCLLPAAVVGRLVYQESIWNHLAATILRSRFPIDMLPTNRGVRYAGQTTMNYGSLVLLGLSAVSVYSDVALLRTLFMSFILSIAAVLGIFGATFIRLFTTLAIPGWASDVVGSMAIILVQCLVVSVFLLFVILSNRSQRGFIAAQHYRDYVLGVSGNG